MTKLTLTNRAQDTTVLENEFIDRYMVKANGEYVKIYLLLLRHLNRPEGILTIPEMADILECTENDIRRALKYWKRQGLLDYCEHPVSEPLTANQPGTGTPYNAGSVTGLPDARISDGSQALKNSSSPVSLLHTKDAGTDGSQASTNVTSPVSLLHTKDAGSSQYTPAGNDTSADASLSVRQYRSRKERKEFKELLFVAEQYLCKTLSSADIDKITYFYDTLHMSAELIEYLIEYCVENGHKSMHYIQKVALSWCEQKITTVAAAKSGTVLYNKNCYSVLNAFGIKGRAPAAAETAYIRKWNEEYGFTLDIILEACNRTMNAIHQPNFEYTDSILKNWLKKNVRHHKDIEALDIDFAKEKEQKKKAVKPASDLKNSKSTKSSKFNNFTGRSYDMDSLERRLVQQ
ncbi:MAG: DnaD domain protein [Dorea sp.]|nr:DnaD domain protein [Dorea sp.]